VCRYLDVGRDIVASLQKSAKCRCGYCHIADVESHEQDDHMESFFLSETVGRSFFYSLHIINRSNVSLARLLIKFSIL
jgi:hypothetical protein